MNLNLPEFNDAYINGIVACFKKRSKALKHRLRDICISMEVDNEDERINIDCESFLSHQIRLSIWGNHYVYFRTCQSSKTGWLHNIALAGYIRNIEPSEFESRLEACIHLSEEESLKAVWSELDVE